MDLDPARPRKAKVSLEERMTSGAHRERTDQPTFSALMNMDQIFDRSRSFVKLCGEWPKQMA